MKRHVKRAATALAALTLTLGAVSCGSDPETPEWEWPDPEPEPDPEPVAGKPRFIWVDAAANFPDFANSREVAPERQISEAAGDCKQRGEIGCRFVKLKSAYYINIGIACRN